MINKIRTKDIIYLLNEFVDKRYGQTVVVNYKDKVLHDKLKELNFTSTSIRIKNNDNLDNYIKEIIESEEVRTLFILFNISNISFPLMLRFARTLYNLDVKYLILTKTSKLDTINTKAFLVFYESYRIIGNVLLLRRLG